MDAMSDRAVVTNEEVAKMLDVTHATISRIRSGDRHPSLELMWRIRSEFQWSMENQTKARRDGQYARVFEKILKLRFG